MISYRILILVFFLCGINSNSFAEQLEINNALKFENMASIFNSGRTTETKLNESEKEDHKKSEDNMSQNKLEQMYDFAHNEINTLTHYVNFGILIAIFYMSAGFRVRKKCLVLISCLMSIISLFFNYIGTWNQVTNFMDMDIMELKICSDIIFSIMVLPTLIAVIFFCILSYKYLFDTNSECENCSKKMA